MPPVWNVPCQTRHNEGRTISEDLVMHIANNQRARTIHRSERDNKEAEWEPEGLILIAKHIAMLLRFLV